MIYKLKKKVANILFSCAAVLSILCSINFPINAASVTVSSGAYTGYSVTSKNANGRWVTNSNVQQILIDGSIGFCIEPGILLSEGSGFNPYSYNDAANLSVIAYEGWVRSNHTMEDYLATQFMIWESVGGSITSTSFSNYESYKSSIQNRINHHNDRPSFHKENLTLKVGESVTLTDKNGVFNQYNLVSSGGLSVSKSGNSLTITGTLNASDNASITYNKIPSNCVGTSIAYSKAGSQSVAKFYVKDPLSTYINVKVLKYGTLKIAKQNELGEMVPNTTFKTSYNADMSGKTWTYTTGADGTVTIPNWEPKTVYIQEVSVPDNLVLNPTIQSIEIIPNDTVTFTQVNNIKRGKLVFKKEDVNNDALVGAKMRIADSEGNTVKEWTSEGESLFSEDLFVEKEYTLYEDEAPAGYVLSKPISFTVKNTEEIQEFKMIDKQVFAMKIDEDGMVLPGAKMQVINTKTKNIVDQWITDDKAHAISGLIEDGEYILQEIEAPEGLKLAEDIKFTVSDEKEVQTLEMSDEYILSKIKVNKVDSYTKEAIKSKDFEFTAYKDKDCKDKHMTVNADIKDGTATFELRFGEWWIKETKAPEGYLLSDEVKHVEIGANGVVIDGVQIHKENQTYSFLYENRKIPLINTSDHDNMMSYLYICFFSMFLLATLWWKHSLIKYRK